MSGVGVHDLRESTILGGTAVQRAVPQAGVRMVGPWCVVDVFGPGADGLPAHALAGVQAMTWLFSGRLRHTDGRGTDQVVGPGEVLMLTAGRGVVHGEESVDEGEPVHGVALRLALPAASRDLEPAVEEFWPEPVRMGDHEAAIFVGELAWEDSPVVVPAPAVGAEVRFASDDPLIVDVPEGWEFAFLPFTEAITVDGVEVQPGQLGHVAPGATSVSVRAHASAGHVVRTLLVGGAALDEPLVHWWDFVGASHDDIAATRRDYLAALGEGEGEGGDPARFPLPPGTDAADAVRPPTLPPGRLVAH